MKTLLFKHLVVLGSLLLITGCKDSEDINGPVQGSGRIVTQMRTLAECTGINLSKTGNVFVSQDTVQSVRIEADDNIIDKVQTDVQGKTIMAGLGDGSYTNVTVRIYVTLKTINNIAVAGSGNINTSSPIDCSDLICSLTGAGNINLQGEANTFNCILVGSGNINAHSLISNDCRVTLTGTGNCTVNAKDKLDATLSGVGSIFYYGNPSSVKTSITGVGQITKK